MRLELAVERLLGPSSVRLPEAVKGRKSAANRHRRWRRRRDRWNRCHWKEGHRIPRRNKDQVCDKIRRDDQVVQAGCKLSSFFGSALGGTEGWRLPDLSGNTNETYYPTGGFSALPPLPRHALWTWRSPILFRLFHRARSGSCCARFREMIFRENSSCGARRRLR